MLANVDTLYPAYGISTVNGSTLLAYFEPSESMSSTIQQRAMHSMVKDGSLAILTRKQLDSLVTVPIYENYIVVQTPVEFVNIEFTVSTSGVTFAGGGAPMGTFSIPSGLSDALSSGAPDAI